MSLPTTPSIDQLKRALAIQEKIAALQEQLVSVLGQSGGSGRGRKAAAASEDSEEPAAKGKGKRKKKRTMSPEAREKIAAAQRKRWAKQKKAAAA